MNQRRLERLRFLSARFNELQGLRVAFAGACMATVLGGYLVAVPQPTNNGALIAMMLSFVPVVPGQWWLNRYYAAAFGRQVWKSSRKAKAAIIVYFSVATALNKAIPALPTGSPTVMIVGLASLWVGIRDWPWRGYYLGITVAIGIAFIASASGAGMFSPDVTLAMLFLVVGTAMVPVGLLDHFLLVKLMKESSEQLNASPAAEKRTQAPE